MTILKFKFILPVIWTLLISISLGTAIGGQLLHAGAYFVWLVFIYFFPAAGMPFFILGTILQYFLIGCVLDWHIKRRRKNA